MKISLISIPLACAVITSCQYRPKNFYADKSPEANVTSFTTPSYNSGGGGNINYLHRIGGTSGTWDSYSGNFSFNNGNTFEVGEDGGKVRVLAELNNLEIIELRLTNVYGGRDYQVDLKEAKDDGVTMKVENGTYRIDVRNRWETHASPAPSGQLTVEW